MKRVYIAHALSGDWRGGVLAAKAYAFAAAKAGHLPVVPYVLMDGILDDTDPEERALGMKLDIDQLRACDEIWLCGERLSPGMLAELDVAMECALTVLRLAQIPEEPRVARADAPATVRAEGAPDEGARVG
jgi:hypothetical protein